MADLTPEDKETFERNKTWFQKELDAANEKMAEIMRAKEQRAALAESDAAWAKYQAQMEKGFMLDSYLQPMELREPVKPPEYQFGFRGMIIPGRLMPKTIPAASVPDAVLDQVEYLVDHVRECKTIDCLECQVFDRIRVVALERFRLQLPPGFLPESDSA